MIHHFKPAITSIYGCPLSLATIGDMRVIIGNREDLTINPDGSVTHYNGSTSGSIVYGAVSDPTTWWVLTDTSGSIWFTTQDPYDDDTYIPAERAR